MTWWQSLFIALIPAIVTAFISLLISHLQIKNTKHELSKKFESEDKLYKTKVRFDTEFSIYKELSEKVMLMVMDSANLFPTGLHYEPLDKNFKVKYYSSLYESCQNSFQIANSTIAKYSIFIPEKWFNAFVEIRNLCHLQIQCYFEIRIVNAKYNTDKEQRECFNRTTFINEKVEKLIKDLRKYIESLDVKDKADNTN